MKPLRLNLAPWEASGLAAGQRGCRICTTRLMKEAYTRRLVKAEADRLTAEAEKEAANG